MKKFESALRHIRFEILPTEYQYPPDWIENGWIPKSSPNDLPYEEWKVVVEGIEKEVGADTKLISQASTLTGVQLGRIAKSARMEPEAFLEKLNNLEEAGKIRFREYVSPLDQDREFKDANPRLFR